jgi:hypothetical protein
MLPALKSRINIDGIYFLFVGYCHINRFTVLNGMIIINNESERRFYEAVMASFELLTQHLRGETE